MKLIATNITTRRGSFALQNISFSLNDKENLVITGASGSGKTTLAKALCGQLFFMGELKTDYSLHSNLAPKAVYVEQRYTIKNRSNTIDGYYQQRYNSADNEDSYTVSEELKFISNDEKRIDFLLNELSISYLKNKPLLQLSSGEHKRFQIVKALLEPAQLLVLDEPFVGLDAASREKLNEILTAVSSAGTKLIVISGTNHHFPDCATHILELENGAQKSFVRKEDFVTGNYAVSQAFNNFPLPLQKSSLNFENAILMKNVTVEYNNRMILDNINWQVKKGERWLLKGRNGAGKSTLMSLVFADNPQAYSNEIYLFDKRRGSGESIWDVKKNIGFVSPELVAFFDGSISCFDAVASGYFDTMVLNRELSKEQVQHINNWFEALNVSNLAQKRLSEISAGMQKIFLLIRTFVKNPPLLILDEPCQGLDESQTEAFVKLVDDSCAQTDTTLVYISHYANEAPACISSVLELENGKQIN